MTQEIDRLDDLAPPRRNGELVFTQPWQGRVFSLALALRTRRPYAWTAFSERFALATQDPDENYYQAWLTAFEALLAEEGVIKSQELDKRALEYKRGTRTN